MLWAVNRKVDQLSLWGDYFELIISSFLACLRMLSTISVRGETLMELRRSMEVLITANFSLSVQSSCSAFSIVMVASGDISLYKYRIRSSGV